MDAVTFMTFDPKEKRWQKISFPSIPMGITWFYTQTMLKKRKKKKKVN